MNVFSVFSEFRVLKPIFSENLVYKCIIKI